MYLKCQKKVGRKLVMLCKKAKTQFVLPPPGRLSPPPEDISDSATPWKKS